MAGPGPGLLEDEWLRFDEPGLIPRCGRRHSRNSVNLTWPRRRQQPKPLGVRFIWVPTPTGELPSFSGSGSLVAELIAELAEWPSRCRPLPDGHRAVVVSLPACSWLKACRQWMLGQDQRRPGLAVPDTPEQRRWLETTIMFG